jgi:hypothetical protein
MIEVRFELGKGSSTGPVMALCLSNIFSDIQNWSSDVCFIISVHIHYLVI